MAYPLLLIGSLMHKSMVLQVGTKSSFGTHLKSDPSQMKHVSCSHEKSKPWKGDSHPTPPLEKIFKLALLI